MSRIVFAHDLRKSVLIQDSRTPFYSRPRLWILLAVLNVILVAAVAMSWKIDSVWSVFPSATAYPVTSAFPKPSQSASGHIIGPSRPTAIGDLQPEPAELTSASPEKTEPLSPQAQKAAQYIAGTYRIAGEASELIVREAYKAGKQNSVDPLLMLAVIAVESRFNPISASSVGALGLTQAMPESHPEKVAVLQREHGHILNIADNIQLGTKVVAEYMRKFDNNTVLALQQYNGSLHDKTRIYSKKVLELRAKFSQAVG